MNQLTGTAKKLDVFFKILFVCTILFTLAAAALTILAFCSKMPGDFAFTISGVTVKLPHRADPSDGLPAALFFCGAMLALAAVVCWGIRVIQRILQPMKQAMPFSPSIHRDLKALGWVTLFGGLVYNLFSLSGKKLLVSLMELSSPGTALGVAYQPEGTFLILAMVLFLFSYIFRYDAALQQQADETL